VSNPLQLEFGGQSYPVAPLSVLKARAWRETLIQSARALSETLFHRTNGHDEEFFRGLGTAYLAFPDKIREMIFLYGEQLPKEEILAAATDEEMIVAFAVVTRAAFPYLHQLSLMVTFDLASRMDEATLANLQSAIDGTAI
jgi:hypothetical protein